METCRLDAVLRHAVLCVVGFLGPGCSLPLVTRAGSPDFDAVHLADRAEVVSCTTEDGVDLRGIYVEATPEAPLVLHLLPRGASATSGVHGFGGFRETLDALRLAGFSSLALDYRGVGASGGEPDGAALLRDARAMWGEALARRDDRAEDVILRGASLGSLAVAGILGDGARPRAVVLAAPVDSETIAENAADERVGSFLAFFARPLLRAPEIRSLGQTLAETRVPVLVLLSAKDPLLPAEEHAHLRHGASASVRFERSAMDHEDLVLRFYGFESSPHRGGVIDTLTSEEAEFLRRVR